jgi:hypothetical protein
MKKLLPMGGLLALVAVAACSDVTPVTPTMSASSSTRALTASGAEEAIAGSEALTQLNARLAATGAKVRVAKAELLMDANSWNGVGATILVPMDRARGYGAEWVPGDPRRDGRIGVTYALGSSHPGVAQTFDGSATPVVVSPAQLDAQIEEGMSAWRAERCSAPITRVPVAAGTDPDLFDDYFRAVAAGTQATFEPSANYVQAADIIQGGWQPASFFRAIAGGVSGNSIIGITLTLTYYGDDNKPTDIDGNGKEDIGISEIFYNNRFAWTAHGTLGSMDFYSIITHETGHALGLNHFGKLFVSSHDAADGIQLADVKYAPYALMNAAYITGRNEIGGTDRSSFCQIWSYAK